VTTEALYRRWAAHAKRALRYDGMAAAARALAAEAHSALCLRLRIDGPIVVGARTRLSVDFRGAVKVDVGRRAPRAPPRPDPAGSSP
jgi:hypothetical protein